MPDLFIIGAGGHAADVADIGAELGYRPIFVTNRQEEIDGWPHADEIILEADALAGGDRMFAIGIGDGRVRSKVARRLRGQSLLFPSLIHPDTSFGRGARSVADAARGTVVFAGARFTNGLRLGDFVVINLNATVSHDVEIGDFANLSPGACVTGSVRVGEGAWLGAGAAVNQGSPDRKLSIGAWSIIGSGAVVIGDCDPGSTYVGVPARKR